MEIYGRFWVKKDAKNFLGLGRIELLRGIAKSGSISKSAKAMYMSYKAAWDSVDAMNKLGEKPLILASTGGKGGGGTKITQEGELAIEAFNELEAAKAAFCEHFNGVENLADLAKKARELRAKIKG